MCEYCEKRKRIYSNNFCGRAQMTIFDYGMLDVQGDSRAFRLFRNIYCPRFNINYCPICRA